MNTLNLFLDGTPVTSSELAPCLQAGETISAFESMRAYSGTIFRMERHLDRLEDSARTAGLPLPKTRAALKHEIETCIKPLGKADFFLRLTVDNAHSVIFVLDRKRPASVYEKGVALKTSVVRRSLSASSPPS